MRFRGAREWVSGFAVTYAVLFMIGEIIARWLYTPATRHDCTRKVYASACIYGARQRCVHKHNHRPCDSVAY